MAQQAEQAAENAIRAVIHKYQVKEVLHGTATNVGETACDVEREGAPTLYGVRLNAIDDDLQSYVTTYPAAKSDVIVGIVEGLKTEAVLLRCSEVAQVKIKIGEQTLVMNEDGVVMNGGTNGLVKADELKTQLDKLSKRVDDVISAITNGVPAAGAPDGGAGLWGTFKTALALILDKEDFEDIEDEKIKH